MLTGAAQNGAMASNQSDEQADNTSAIVKQALEREDYAQRTATQQSLSSEKIIEIYKETEKQFNEHDGHAIKLSLVGRGNFGVVFKGWSEKNQCQVAIKKLLTNCTTLDGFRDALTEISILKCVL